MSTLDHEILSATKLFRPARQGPVTAALHRRNLMVYLAICAIGLLPTLLGASAAWRAFGLGLLLPGGGFVAALGISGILALALTLGMLYLALVAWFWNGMVVAPLTVWLGSALVAGALADGSTSALGLPAMRATPKCWSRRPSAMARISIWCSIRAWPTVCRPWASSACAPASATRWKGLQVAASRPMAKVAPRSA